jgi:phage major head subunit gpT-like protein
MQTYNPSLLLRGTLNAFLRDLAGAEQQSFVPLIASVIPSDGNKETYGWIGESPVMSEWDGEVHFIPMSDTSYEITNKKYATGIVISRDDLADDQLGGFPLRVNQLARGVVAHRNSLLINALINGTTNTGHDGAAFFSNSHPARGQQTAAQDNLLAGTGTTTAQIQADIVSALVALMGFLAENGEMFHDMPSRFVLVCHPARLAQVNEALYAQLISNTSNVQLRGFTIDPLYTPRLSDTNDWYLLHVGSALRPLILQDREAVTLETADNASEAYFAREQIEYKLRGRYAVGYGHWANAVKVVNT